MKAEMKREHRTAVMIRRIDLALWRRARAQALEEGITMREFVERALRTALTPRGGDDSGQKQSRRG
jgi:predicted HicB family RNase H-like nuclease